MDWIVIVRDVGVPIALLGFLGWGIVQVVYWLAPRIDRLLTGHCHLVEVLPAQLERQTDCLEALSTNQQAITQTQTVISETQTEILTILKSNSVEA